MPCYHPLIGVDCGRDENGKRDVKILPQGAISSDAFDHGVGSKRVFDIPCGHCVGCRVDQAREWSNRLLMESLYHESAHFITLTYCKEYVHLVEGTDLYSGEYKVWQTLFKDDLTLFMKRLRRKFLNNKLRFYAAGEYGEKSERPHFHLVVFGLPPDQLQLIPSGRSETGQQYFECPQIEDCWKITDEYADRFNMLRNLNEEAKKRKKSGDLIGFCSIEPANYYTMKYVANYVTKKLGNKPNLQYELEGRLPPYSVSSRKPGIGYQYLEDHPECMEDDKIVIGTPSGKVEFPPPRYFRKKAAEYDPGLVDEKTEEHIKKSAAHRAAELSKTDLCEREYLEVKESKHLNRIKMRDTI